MKRKEPMPERREGAPEKQDTVEREDSEFKNALVSALKRDVSGANLTGVDLTGVDLRGVDFTKADLEGAKLRRADLRGANLTGVDLTTVDIWSANLREAIMSREQHIYAREHGAIVDGGPYDEPT